MNKPLRRVAIFCGLLVLALLIRVNWVQFVQADELQNDSKNRRLAIERYSQPRGDIIVDGDPVTGHTTTDSGDFTYKRTYRNGEMWAPVTGYASQVYDANQLEKLYDGILTGDDDRLAFPPDHVHRLGGMNHLDLLNHPRVYEQIRRWLETRPEGPRPDAPDEASITRT